MKYQVYLSERAEKNLYKIFIYLQNNWSEKVKNNFKNKLLQKIEIIKNNPYSFPSSNIKKEIRRCVITKHNTMYYRIKNFDIEIITIQDTRQNPENFNL